MLSLLQPQAGQEEALATALNQTAITQPALFAVGYGLAQLWRSWGVQPDLLCMAKGLGGGFPIGAIWMAKMTPERISASACCLNC